MYLNLFRVRSVEFDRKAELFSNREAIVIALKETLRYGLFLGTFAGTFVSVDEIIAALGGHRRHVSYLDLWKFFVSFSGPNFGFL